ERARAKEKGEKLREEPPRIPPTLKTALKQFYEHYEEEFHHRRHSLGETGVAQLGLEDTPPVFIVVCNNTSVSKEVFKYLAGYEVPNGDPSHPAQVVTGAYELLSNYDPGTLKPKSKP